MPDNVLERKPLPLPENKTVFDVGVICEVIVFKDGGVGITWDIPDKTFSFDTKLTSSAIHHAASTLFFDHFLVSHEELMKFISIELDTIVCRVGELKTLVQNTQNSVYDTPNSVRPS